MDVVTVICLSIAGACFGFMIVPVILFFFRMVLSWQTEIDIVVRACKLDTIYRYKTGSISTLETKAVLINEEKEKKKEHDEAWAVPFLDPNGWYKIPVLIYTMMVHVFVHYHYLGYLYGGRFVYNCCVSMIHILLVNLIISKIFVMFNWYAFFTYKANISISTKLRNTLLLRMNYHHLNGYDFTLIPIEVKEADVTKTPESEWITESEKRIRRNYDILVAGQWDLLCTKYKVVDSPKQLIRLYEDDFGVDNPVMSPNRSKLLSLGYDVIDGPRDGECHLKYNGEQTHYERFRKAQMNTLVDRYLTQKKCKQCFKVELDIIDEDNGNPILGPNVDRLLDSGYEISYHHIQVGDRKVRQLQLRFTYKPPK